MNDPSNTSVVQTKYKCIQSKQSLSPLRWIYIENDETVTMRSTKKHIMFFIYFLHDNNPNLSKVTTESQAWILRWNTFKMSCEKSKNIDLEETNIDRVSKRAVLLITVCIYEYDTWCTVLFCTVYIAQGIYPITKVCSNEMRTSCFLRIFYLRARQP